jgi:hypothetical protein
VELVLGAVVVALAIAFVAYPLLRPSATSFTAVGSSLGLAADDERGGVELSAAREAIYREILELEFDHRIGKLDDADYTQLAEACLARAAALVAESDAREAGLEDRVEQEIASMRAALRRAGTPSTRESGAT